jgi:hypothetical protein
VTSLMVLVYSLAQLCATVGQCCFNSSIAAVSIPAK